MNCNFQPPSELIIRSQPFSGLHVSWWSQEQATKETEKEGCRSAVCSICVSYCSIQIQKGEAWLNPFYFLGCLLCVGAQRHPRIFLYMHLRALFSCILVYWGVSECGCCNVWFLHLFFSLSHQCIVRSTSSL